MTREPAIWTASWHTLLPSDFVVIGISRSTPRGRRGFRRLRALEPGRWWNSVDEATYCRLYHDEILRRLDASEIVDRVRQLAGLGPAALTCWERPGEGEGPCHRGQTAAWITERTGIVVREFGHDGFGRNHPMLSPHAPLSA